MAHEFDSGLLLRDPAWHGLGTVVEEWPGSWKKAREMAGFGDWDVTAHPVYLSDLDGGYRSYVHDVGYQAIMRDDQPLTVMNADKTAAVVNPNARLAIQPASYQIITNAEFGRLIEEIADFTTQDWDFETLISLSGGRQIIALLRSKEPLHIGPDSSKTYQLLAITSRHDGQGGLRIIPTNIRIVCANTRNWAESVARAERVGWTIRHTANWEERFNEAKRAIAEANRESQAWAELATRLGSKKLDDGALSRMLQKLIPTSSDMSDRQVANTRANRDTFMTILRSPTCTDISHTLLGFVQAADEYAGWARPARSAETRTARSLLTRDPIKAKALQIASSQLN